MGWNAQVITAEERKVSGPTEIEEVVTAPRWLHQKLNRSRALSIFILDTPYKQSVNTCDFMF